MDREDGREAIKAQYIVLIGACVNLSNWGVVSEKYTLKSKFGVLGVKNK